MVCRKKRVKISEYFATNFMKINPLIIMLEAFKTSDGVSAKRGLELMMSQSQNLK